jgi:hypothetical protein
MADNIHPAAPHHLPAFIVGPGETDILMSVMAVVLIAAVLLVGVLYFRLHALPEQLAHKSHKLQLNLVAVLGLLALFTHEHLFWIAGLLLAIIEFPDFSGMLGRITRSLEKMAGIRSPEEAVQPTAEISASETRPGEVPSQYEPVDGEARAADEEVAPVPELRTGSTRG